MERIVIGKTGLKVYRVGFGGIPIQTVGEKQAVETVAHAVNRGVDFIDTSRAYTTSERRIGKALKQTGKKVVLASKSTSKSSRNKLDLAMREMHTNDPLSVKGHDE